MKKFWQLGFIFIFFACAGIPQQQNIETRTTQEVPVWVNNLEQAFPSRDWVAVVSSGNSQVQAENAAMNALARAFRTDVESLTQASQQFSQIVNEATGMRNISFEQSQNFSQEVNTYTNVRGLVGVQLDMYQTQDNTFYVNARMNRRESASRYSAMIQENTAIVNRLLADAARVSNQASFEVYAKLSFAHAIAQVSDNFQRILEVLDPTAVNRRPSYGGVNAIRARMLECAGRITIGVSVNTAQMTDRTLITRAAGTFFRDLGFRINEQGQGIYVLHVNVRFEELRQNVISSRYYLDAALSNRNGIVIFPFTEDDRGVHPNSASEARRLALQEVETSFKEGKFAQEFTAWLNTLVE